MTTVPDPTAGQLANTQYFVPMETGDTLDWETDSTDSTKLVCKYSGIWQIIVQHQNYNLDGQTGELNGWVVKNDQAIDLSDAADSTMSQDEVHVLTIAFTAVFNKGDTLQLGVMSYNSDSSDTTPHTAVKAFQRTSLPVAPSVILSLTRTGRAPSL